MTAFRLRSREAAVEYAKEKGVPIAQTKKENLFARPQPLAHFARGRRLEDPANEP